MNYSKSLLFITALYIIYSCSICEENNTNDPPIEEPQPESLGNYINAIKCDADNNIYIGVEFPGAVYKLSNDGNINKANLENFKIGDLMITSSNVIYAMRSDWYYYQDSSIVKSFDNGNTWHFVDIPVTNFNSIIEIPNNVLIAGAREAIYISENNNWTKKTLPLIGNENVSAREINIDGNSNLWIEMRGGMRSYLLKYNLQTSGYKYYGDISHASDILISEDNDVFISHQAHDEASGSVSRVLASVDTVEFLPIPHTMNFGLYVSELDFYKGKIIASTGEGIMLSEDKCESWTQVMPDSFFTALEVDNNDKIYAGTINGYLVQVEDFK